MAKKKSTLASMDDEENKIEKKLLQKEEKIHQKVFKYLHLHMDNYGSSHGRIIEMSLLFLNLFAIILFVIETHDISQATRDVLRVLEISVVFVFILEYAARMWVAQHKLRHFRNVYSIIDLLSILPVLIEFINLSFLRIFRILRLVRLIRILRFQRMFKEKDTILGKFTEMKLITVRILLTVFTIVFVSSGLIWAVENKVNPESLGTIWDAMYFAVVTLSTVGYGDVTAVSVWGKIITILMILSGITLIPWQLGKLVKVLVRGESKESRSCKKCGLQEHEADATFCKLCGTKLGKKKKSKEPDSSKSVK